MDQLLGMVQPGSPTAAATHAAHKIPSGDGPYARAKHFQLVEKDLEASIAWFWKAINTGDKLDSALKDMAVVMKQRGYLTEAIDAIKSLRNLCPKQTKEEIELLKQKLRKIYLGEAFHGKTMKRARSHGRKIHVSIKQETSRVLGNLAWAYMQQRNFMAAEVVYRKAQMVDPDANKACNLALCLIEQSRFADAEQVLGDVLAGRFLARDHQDGKILRKVQELLARIVAETSPHQHGGGSSAADDQQEEEDREDDDWVEREILRLLDVAVTQWGAPYRKGNRRLPVFEEISSPIGREQMAC
ncbi:hypothetical protein PR202_gb18686 [Eleusine coracana subsp. coracana]|uniref:Protein SULFUR DEFICIENCY-INDUCED 1 n=1 Tax=Eleusine coracana subsp. coracana TaxID=191504 RepID=A0AAV5F418_ELECO|nr:hypothetical protein PR202_gb18686 [Eleusine coracana subsp. coracana]